MTQLPTQLKQDQYKELKRLIDPKDSFNEDQLRIFFHLAKNKSLDPFQKQIYATPIWNQHTKRNELIPIVSIDGFRLIAERTGKYSPGKATEYHFDDKGRFTSCTVHIRKQTEDGTWHDISETGFLCEYQNQRNSIWKQLPTVMLSKCVEARLLRRAFPGETSGIYAQEEMDQAKKDLEEEPKKENKKLKPEQLKELEERIAPFSEFKEKVLLWVGRNGGTTLGDMPAQYFENIMKQIIKMEIADATETEHA